MMHRSTILALAAAAAIALASAVPVPPPAKRGASQRVGLATLVPTGTRDGVAGNVRVRRVPRHGHSPSHSWLRFRLTGLEPGVVHAIYADDPATPEDPALADIGVSLLPGTDGVATYGVNTKYGSAFPFAATLAALAGQRIEIRDVGGTAVLTGRFPALPRRAQR